LVESGALSPGRLVGETVALEDVSDVLTSMSDYETVGMPVITSF
jgi:hypothetical protein